VLETTSVFWGVKDPNGMLYLVADDSAADAIADEWERADCELVYQIPGSGVWRHAELPRQHQLLERARRAREQRQAILGPMEP